MDYWLKKRSDVRPNFNFGAVVRDVLKANDNQLNANKLRSKVGALQTNAQLAQLAIARTPKTLMGIDNNKTKYDRITKKNTDPETEIIDMFNLFDTYDADRKNFKYWTKLETLLRKYIWDKSAELQLKVFLLKQKEKKEFEKKIYKIKDRNLGRPISEVDAYIKSMFGLYDRYSRQLLTKQDEYESLLKFVNEYINVDPNIILRNFLIKYDNKDRAYENAISLMKKTTFYFDPNITIKKSLHTYLSKLYGDFVILKESLNEIRIIIDPNSSEIKKSKEDVNIETPFSHSNFVECMKSKTFDFLFILTLNYDNLVIKIKNLNIDKEILDIASDKLKMDGDKERITKTMLGNVLKIEKILDKFRENESYDTLIKDYKPVIFNMLENMQHYFAVIDHFIMKVYDIMKVYKDDLFNEEQVKILVTNMEILQHFIDANLLIHKELIKIDEKIELHPTFSFFLQSVRESSKFSDLPDFQDDPDDLNGGRRNPKKKPTKKPTKLNRGADMNMKDIRGLCKANQIKLSTTKDGVRIIYKKKELITKLKRKKIL